MTDKGEHWLDRAILLLTADTVDLRKLAHLAGQSPKSFYRGANLAGADLRGQKLGGMDFTNADLKNVLIDKNTQIDPEYLFEALGGAHFTTGEITDKLLVDEGNGPALPSQSSQRELEIDDPETVIAIARDMQKRGSVEQALNFLEQYREVFIGNPGFVIEYGDFLRRHKRLHDAVGLYREALELNPNDRMLLYRGSDVALLARDFEFAELTAHKLVHMDEQDINANLLLAEIYSKSKRPREAFEIYKSIIPQMPVSFDSWSQLGKVLLARSNAEGALLLLNETNERRPQNNAVLNMLLQVASDAERNDVINDALRRSLVLEPRRGAVRAILQAMKNSSKASKRVRDCLIQTGLWKLDLGLLSLVAGKLQRDDIDSAIHMIRSSGTRDAVYRRALALLLISKGPEHSPLSELTSMTRENPQIIKAVVQKLASQSRFDHAISIIRSALERDSNSAALHKWLIETLVIAGRYDLASQEALKIVDKGLPFGKSTMKLIKSLIPMTAS